METDVTPHVGDVLVVRLRLPEMIMGWRVPEWQITGHVVHFASASAPGKFSVGVQFNFYETVVPVRRLPPIETEAGALPVIVRMERP